MFHSVVRVTKHVVPVLVATLSVGLLGGGAVAFAPAARAATPATAAAAALAQPPSVTITKGIANIDGLPAGGNPADVDHGRVHEGSAAVFRVDLTNQDATVPVSNLRVWDVLPAGTTCAHVSAVSDAGSCSDPGDPTQPDFALRGLRSAIVWTSAPDLAPGASRTLTYTVTIPPATSVSSTLLNTASLRSYDVVDVATHTYYPADNVDTTVPSDLWDAPAASDDSDLFLADVAVTNGTSSAINESGNVGLEATPQAATQATIGETVTFTAAARIPAGSTAFNGTFRAFVPTGLTLLGATASYRPDAGSATTTALPAGVGFTSAGTPTVTFPQTYDNGTGTDQVFTVTLTAVLDNTGSNANAVSRRSVASFQSATQSTGGSSIPQRSATASVTVVEPMGALTKTNDAGGPVVGGQTLVYTLKASSWAGRPPLHEAWQLDCLPVGLSFAAYGSPPSGVTTSAPVVGDGVNGCPSGYTVLSWNLGDLAGGQSRVLTYAATVDPGAAGRQSLVNVAALSGNSLGGVRTSPIDGGNAAGRIYSSAASSTVTIGGATAAMTVTPGSATVGQAVLYRASGILPAGVTSYNTALIDALPAGIDPASVQLAAVTCTNADATPCSLTSATLLTSGTGTAIGWLLGDVTPETQNRTVTVSFTATVADVVAATAGSALVSRMHVAWDTAPRTPPTSASSSFNQASTDVAAAITVVEPSLSLTKAVGLASPAPGQAFSYTVTASNANAPSTSAAYGVVVTDLVPAGVVVDPASISGGGTIAGANAATGGGTISWNLSSPIVPATSTVLTYQATLAPSATLTNGGLKNTARITGYDSLSSGGRHYTGPSASRTVTPTFPRLAATKAPVSGTTAYLDSPLPWRVTTTNVGGSTAYQVGVVDTLPANWAYQSGSAQVSVNAGPSVQVEPVVTTSGSTQTLTWTGLGTLPAGASLSLTYSGVPTAAAASNPGAGLLVNHVNTASTIARDSTGAAGNALGTYGSAPATSAVHIASADLSLATEVGTAPTAGGSGSWVVSVSSSGPDPAVGPFSITDDFTDSLPDGVTVTSATGPGWTCSTGAPVTCSRTIAGELLAPGGAFPPVTITYAVAPDVEASTVLGHRARVSARTYDPQPANDTATAQTAVATSADLAVTKVLSAGGAVAGQDVSWSLEVTNVGPSAARGPVTVTDALPEGTTFVSVATPGWTCDPVARGALAPTLACRFGDGTATLPVGSVPSSIVVTVHLPSGWTGDLSNTASVSSPTPDPATANNSSTVTSSTSSSADLFVQKTRVTSAFLAGAPATYRIEVRNLGSSDATGVTVTDVLPRGLTFRSFTGTEPAWSCSATGAAVTCARAGSLAPSGTPTGIDLVVDVSRSFTGDAVNTATVSSATPDPVSSNNSSTDDSSVATAADLQVVKTHSGTVAAGLPLTWRIGVTNHGPSDVTAPVTVSDALPAGVDFGSATGAGWVCDYAAPTRLVTCALAAGLRDGELAAPIDITTTVPSAHGPGGLENTASVTSLTADPDLTNNASTDHATVAVVSDLRLTKTLDTPAPVVAGTKAVFTLTAANDGPSDASTVVVRDVLPSGLTALSATGAGWACDRTPAALTCTRALLEAGTAAPPITLTTRVDPATPVTLPAATATLVNTATVDAATPGGRIQPDPVQVPVVARADLGLSTVATARTVRSGNVVGWTVSVSNAGPSDAAGAITVIDTLPGFQTFVSASGQGWSCVAGPAPTTPGRDAHQDVTCTHSGGLAAGAVLGGLALTAVVDPGAPSGMQTNTANATSPTPGTPGMGSGAVVVGRAATLSLTKTHVGIARVGADLDFRLVVTNTGQSVADRVEVRDPLPEGLTFVSGSGEGWTCDAPAGTTPATCRLTGTVPPGKSAATLTITTRVHAAAYPGVTNVATVGSASADLPGTADASDVVLVEPDVRLALTKSVVSQVDGRITYRIAVTNAGQSTTTDPIIVTDRLPDGLTVLSAAGPGWSCVSSASLVTCSDPIHLAPGQSAALDLITSVTAAVGRSVTNVASVSGGGAAGATRSNAATAVVAAATTDDGTGGPRAADGGSRDTATDGPAGGPGDGPALAHTGTSVLGSVVAGLLLLLLGGLALAGRRRSAW